MDKYCPDCMVAIGELHLENCDVERCPDTGGQLLSCDCDEHTAPRIPWKGEWPGIAECQELGWYAKLFPDRGWVPCAKDAPGATEDLNRLLISGKWDREKARFVLP